MNETMQLLQSRKSVRVYEPRPIEPEKKQSVLQAAAWAPTAGNQGLYAILDITDPELKQRLSISCDNQPFIASAPMVLVFCVDYLRWYELFCAHMDEPVRRPGAGDLMLAASDAVIAAQNAVIAGESLGLGSCYIGDILENYELHREMLQLPDYVVPVCMLCMGYPTQQQKDRTPVVHFAPEDLVHENGYRSVSPQRMEEMLRRRDKTLQQQAFGDWVRWFCKRKWNSEFSREMSRSCESYFDIFRKND